MKIYLLRSEMDYAFIAYAFIADSAIAVFNVYFNLLEIKTLV